MKLLELLNVTKTYCQGEALSVAVQDISVTIERGEFTAFAGSSGSGKTTLLNLMGGLDIPTSGKVMLDDVELSTLSSKELANIRKRRMGFVFQTFNLLPVLTGLENVEYPLLRLGLSAKEIKNKSLEAIARVGLQNVMHHRPNQMSGGQRQRVAIARAIVHKPNIIFADEPTANLDKKTASEIIELMKSLNEENAVTFIFSTHDSMIMAEAKRIIQISDGQIIKEEQKPQKC